MINHLKQWWATHLTLIAGIVTFLTPSVQSWVTSHPKSSVTVASLWAIITNLVPSPVHDAVKSFFKTEAKS